MQKTTFPAREIYERTLPEVVHRLCDTFYHPGSPWGGKDTRDPTVGDIHQWVRLTLFLSVDALADSVGSPIGRLAVSHNPLSDSEKDADDLLGSGTQPYQNWDKLGGRFISEFGMQGYPDVKTID